MSAILYTCRPSGANDNNTQCVIGKKKQNADLRSFSTTFLKCQKGRGNPAPTVSPVPFALLFDFDDQLDFDGDAAG